MQERNSGRNIGRDWSQRCWDRSESLMIWQGHLMIYRSLRMFQSTRRQYHLKQAQKCSKGASYPIKSLRGTRISKWMKSASSPNSDFTSSRTSNSQNLQRVNSRSTKRRSSSSKRYMPRSWDNYDFNTSNPNSSRRTTAHMARQPKSQPAIASINLQSSLISMQQLSNRRRRSWSSLISTSFSREMMIIR